jgi:hypothetical protein
MSTSARVSDIDPIRDFRVYLTKFQEMAGRALGDADSEIHSLTRSLEGEWINYWTSTVRKRQEILAKAEEAFRFKRLYKDASGSTPSAVEEQKAVQVAKKRLEEAQTKVANIKRATKALLKATTEYRGGVGRFNTSVMSGVPAAIAHLGVLLQQLDTYMGIQAETVGEEALAAAGVGSGAETGGASMARASDQAPKAWEENVDPAELRGAVPSEQALFAAKPAAAGELHLSCAGVTGKQAAAIGKIASGNAAINDERIVISPGICSSSTVFLVRLGTTGISWYLGPVDGLDTGVYNTVSVGDLRNVRPDFEPLLKMPAGSLAVVGPNGASAIYNAQNANLLAEG